MNTTLLSLVTLAALSGPAASATWTTLDTVAAQGDFAFHRDTLVLQDFDLVPDTTAYLRWRTVQGATARVPLSLPSGTYWMDYDYAAGHLWLQALASTAAYSMVHQRLDGSGRTTVGTSTKYRESVRAGGDRAVWVDYRNLSKQSPNNTEIYTTTAPTFIETRLTSDALYQTKARTNGTHVAWMEYDAAASRANIVLHDTRTGQTKAVAPGTWHQDNPWLSDSLLVWTDYRTNMKEGDIHAYDLATGTNLTICTATGHQDRAAAWGRTVAWEDYRAGQNADIRVWSPARQMEIEVSRSPEHSTLPKLDGKHLAWYEISGVVAVALADLDAATGIRPRGSSALTAPFRVGNRWALAHPLAERNTGSPVLRWRNAQGANLAARWEIANGRILVDNAPTGFGFLQLDANGTRSVWRIPEGIRQ